MAAEWDHCLERLRESDLDSKSVLQWDSMSDSKKGILRVRWLDDSMVME